MEHGRGRGEGGGGRERPAHRCTQVWTIWTEPPEFMVRKPNLRVDGHAACLEPTLLPLPTCARFSPCAGLLISNANANANANADAS